MRVIIKIMPHIKGGPQGLDSSADNDNFFNQRLKFNVSLIMLISYELNQSIDNKVLLYVIR